MTAYYRRVPVRTPRPPTLVDITPPNIEPVTLDEAKAHLRLTSDNDDAMLETYIAAARRTIEQRSGTRLMTQVVELARDDFPEDWREMSLMLGNVRSVDSIKYRDSEGMEATLAADDYVAVVDVSPAAVRPKDGSWPAVSMHYPRSVRVRMTCGYLMTASVDRSVKTAVLMLAAHWFENREVLAAGKATMLPVGIDALLEGWPMANFEALGG